MRKKPEELIPLPRIFLAQKSERLYPNFPSRHFLKLAPLYLLNCLITTTCSKKKQTRKKKSYWLLKLSLYKWINKASNGKSSSYLIAIAALAFTPTESDQRQGDPADLMNSPGCVLEGIVCVWRMPVHQRSPKTQQTKLDNIWSKQEKITPFTQILLKSPEDSFLKRVSNVACGFFFSYFSVITIDWLGFVQCCACKLGTKLLLALENHLPLSCTLWMQI